MIIQTTKGKVEGFETEGVLAWYGIPYGQSPTEELRFKRAKPANPWQGVKDCKTYGNDPIQFISERETENEDCLNLNIWAPKEAKKLPVLVWIYGGGFHYGFNSDLSYDGASMTASGDVIRVNINFRIGPLGYYDFNQYDESFDTNCALSDQIEALKWVRDNIEAFGGDPGNITIAGESGGGCAVYNLLASPAAKGLFHKAIAQSGLPRASGGREFTKLVIPHFLELLDIRPEEIMKLKTMDIAKIKEAGSIFYNKFTKLYDGNFMPGPFFGDDLLPERHWTALKNGSAKGVDVIIGYTRDEGDTFIAESESSNAWFPSWDGVEAMLKNNGKEQHFSELKAAYNHLETERKGLSEFVRDYLFAMDAHRCADEQAKHGNVWMYRFDFVPIAYKQMNMGAVHAVEIPFSLNTLDRGYFSYALKGTPQDQLEAVRDQMNAAWFNFMKTGNPTGGEVDWAKYDNRNSMLHVFDLQPANESIRIDKKITDVWEKIGLVYDKE
ncbi:carboxylesterase/lipase family protein [Paenibacillus sinopodophylli]|uniref:carboxylesterase/lipase family protein n=1 Tax=Paenibacillus sinopodophylli TaxID=1837342 RepID=UPI00110D15DA|nr:carboxylesterase/lipase family protein [Paenibacillus sinopodophylli]